MQRMKATCGTCGGFGTEVKWIALPIDEYSHVGTMKQEVRTCSACAGNGYTEYAVFSIEEAEAILKHCGLDKE